MRMLPRGRPTLAPALVALLGLALGSWAVPGAAQTADELSTQATDPTAPLLAINLFGTASTSYHDLDESGFEMKFQPVIPFSAFGMPNLLRVIAPYQMSGPGAEGLKDVSIFNLTVVGEDWGRWGVGAVANLAEGVSDRDAQFAFGPAAAAVYNWSPTLQLGVFNRNLFGDETAITQLQPIVAYQLGNGWALSAGDLQWIYDWKAGSWIQFPLGFQLGLVRAIAGQPMRFSINPQWNVRDRAGTFESKIVFGVALLAPSGG